MNALNNPAYLDKFMEALNSDEARNALGTPEDFEKYAEKLMKDMDKLLDYGVEGLSDALKENLHTKEAFEEIAEVIGEASTLIRRTNTCELF